MSSSKPNQALQQAPSVYHTYCSRQNPPRSSHANPPPPLGLRRWFRSPPSMKQAISVLLLLAALLTSRAGEPAAKDGWSETINGLRARLVFGEGTVVSGTRIPKVYIELYNASDVANPIEFEFSAGGSLQFALRTLDDKPAPKPSGMVVDGFVLRPFQIMIPRDGTLKFPVTWHGYGIKPNFGTLLCFESAFWEIPNADQTLYLLSATLEVPETPREPRKTPRWHGTIKLPPVKAPTSK